MQPVRHLLFDIEGTTTSISFVHDVLFPFARQHVREFVTGHWASLTPLFAELSAVDGNCAVDTVDHVCACVERLMDADRKVAPLKALQGMVWKLGYESGALVGHLYDDVLPFIRRANVPASIYSSGSVEAQRLLFGHTSDGNVLDLFTSHFDTTNAGSKVDAASYIAIARALNVDPGEILFVTDNIREAEAAKSVGMRCAVSVRPGTAPLPADTGFAIVTSFDQLDALLSGQ
jgi:enolase-phosphatase E1